MKNGTTSRNQLWSDIKNGTLRPMEEYECISSEKNYEDAVKFLEYLNEYSKQGVSSVSGVIGEWAGGKKIHTLCVTMCRFDIHPDHWLQIIEAYTNRSDTDTKVTNFLKRPEYVKLWGEDHASPRNNRKKSLSKKQLEAELEATKAELEEYIEAFEPDLDALESINRMLRQNNDTLSRSNDTLRKRNQTQAKQKEALQEQLLAEEEYSSGDFFEKELTLKDLNGTPDELGWYKLDQARKQQQDLEAHFCLSPKQKPMKPLLERIKDA